jgi:hypothetical protein
MVGPAERLGRVALAAEEVGLPGGEGGDAGHPAPLADVGHRVGGLGRGGGQHQVDALAPEQVARDRGRPLGVRLAVLDQDLDRVGAPAQGQPVPQPGPDAVEHEGVGLAEGHQRAALGRDVAEPDRPVSRLRRARAAGGQGASHRRRPGQLQEGAPTDRSSPGAWADLLRRRRAPHDGSLPREGAACDMRRFGRVGARWGRARPEPSRNLRDSSHTVNSAKADRIGPRSAVDLGAARSCSG